MAAGHWMTDELGHLGTNSVKEQDSEEAAFESRRQLEDARKENDIEAARSTTQSKALIAEGSTGGDTQGA